MSDKNCGHLFIVAAPSGGGKTTLVKKAAESLPNLEISVSHTTREKRPLERAGLDYFFVQESEFLRMLAEGTFIEHARVFNYYYGTSKIQIESRLAAGLDVILDIDWQGAQQIKRLFKNATSIFIIPPSIKVLKQRLMVRRQDNEQVIENRMQQAEEELSHYQEFDYLIVNDDFDKAAFELQAIIVSHRLTMAQQQERQRKLLSFLLASQ